MSTPIQNLLRRHLAYLATLARKIKRMLTFHDHIDHRGRPKRLAYVLLFALALSARIGYLLVFRPAFQEWPDCRHYEAIGWRLAQGLPYDDPTESPPAIYRPPLVPVYIATVYRILGRAPLAAQLGNALLGALGVLALARCASILGGANAGVTAGLTAALYPYFIFVTGTCYPEALGIPLISTLVLVLVKNTCSPRLPRAAMGTLGALIGIGALCRPNWLVTLPLAIPAVYLARRSRGKPTPFASLGIALVAWACVWTPWSVRNLLTYDGLILITASGGLNFYYGNHPEATWLSKTAVPPPPQFPGLGPKDTERRLYSLGWQYVREDPERFISLWAAKLLGQWQPMPNIKDHEIPPLKVAVAAVSYTLLLFSTIVGVVPAIRNRRSEILLLLSIAVADSCLAAFFIAPTRLRLPFDNVLILTAVMVLLRSPRRNADTILTSVNR